MIDISPKTITYYSFDLPKMTKGSDYTPKKIRNAHNTAERLKPVNERRLISSHVWNTLKVLFNLATNNAPKGKSLTKPSLSVKTNTAGISAFNDQSERTTRRHLRALEELGLITVVPSNGLVITLSEAFCVYKETIEEKVVCSSDPKIKMAVDNFLKNPKKRLQKTICISDLFKEIGINYQDI